MSCPHLHRLLIVASISATALFASLVAIGQCAQIEGKEKEDILDRADLAWKSARKVMQSITAKGSYRIEVQGKPFEAADLELESDEKKFILVLNDKLVQPALPKSTKRAAFSDGNAITIADFAREYRPSGCQVEVFDTDLSGFVFATRIRFFLPDLCEELIDVGHARTKVNLRITRLESGEHTAAYDFNENTHVEFDVDPKANYNIVRRRVSNPTTNYVESKSLEWKQIDDAWIIAKIECAETRSENVVRQDVLTFDEIAPKSKIDPRLLTIETLKANPGSRVIDRRPGANPPVYRLPDKNAE